MRVLKWIGGLVVALFVLVFGSVVASESRGAIVASGIALVFFVGLLPRPIVERAKLLGGVAILIVLAVAIGSLRFVGNTQIQTVAASEPSVTTTTTAPATVPATQPTVSTTTPAAEPATSGISFTHPEGQVSPLAIYPPDRSGELGHPFLTGVGGSVSAFTSSGRIAAWRGALRTAQERPLFGFGFGTEDRVFVDRYYIFQGARPENAYIGWLLQVGVAGLLAFAIFGLSLLWAVIRVIPRLEGQTRSAPLALAAVTLGGFLAAFFQSYVYAAGNLAVLTFWVAALALATTTITEETAKRG